MKLYRNETIIILIVIFVTIFLNLFTFLYRGFTTPAGRSFTGAQFYTDDYAVYVSYINQGRQGKWMTVDQYTSEKYPSSLVHEEYLLWGKLTGVLQIPPIIAYHLARAVLGIVFLLVIYLFLLRLFPTKEELSLRLGSFLLITFAGGFIDNKGQLFLNWLTEIDPAQRFGALPHYLIGFIAIAGIFLLYFSKVKWKLLISMVLAFISSFVLPSGIIVAISTLGLYLLAGGRFVIPCAPCHPDPAQRRKDLIQSYHGILHPRFRMTNINRDSILLMTATIIGAIPAFLYYRWILNIPPWSHILSWEQVNKGPASIGEYFLSLGPISLLALLGFIAWKNYRTIVVFLSSWVASVLIWSFILADQVALNPTRFLQTPVYIPLAILTVLGLSEILKKKVFVWLSVLVIILLGLPSLVVSVKNQMGMFADYSELIYPGTDLVGGFDYLKKKTQPDEAVLTLYQAGNLIPFMAGNTVYLGHLQETIDYQKKVALAMNFYAGKMASKEAQDFLNGNNIKLIFFSPQEKYAGGNLSNYSFLKSVYNNPTVTIFRVKNNNF